MQDGKKKKNFYILVSNLIKVDAHHLINIQLCIHASSLNVHTRLCLFVLPKSPSVCRLETPFLLFHPGQKQRGPKNFYLSTSFVMPHQCYFQPLEANALDQGPSIHTSQNHSINKSPLWYLSKAWDLRLPLCSVKFARLFGATFV